MPSDEIVRPEYAEGYEFCVYNVGTWGKLWDEEVRHDEYGVGTVERVNNMSKRAWVRFDDALHIVHYDELEMVAEDGGMPDEA